MFQLINKLFGRKKKQLEAYTDGSFHKRIPLWAFVIVQGKQQVFKAHGTLGGPVVDLAQIGGELYAVMQALTWAKNNNSPIVIVHDYEGVRMWVADLWDEKPWATKNKWAQAYRAFILAHKAWLVDMRSVRSHTGVFWNEVVDQEARAILDEVGLVNHYEWDPPQVLKKRN